jgi:hypothetical protein
MVWTKRFAFRRLAPRTSLEITLFVRPSSLNKVPRARNIGACIVCVLTSLFSSNCYSLQEDTKSPRTALVSSSQTDTEDAVKHLLSSSTDERSRTELIQALRLSLHSPSTQKQVLAALAKFPVVQFDADLALLLTSESKFDDLPLLLDAIISSGSLSSEGGLATMATDLTVLPATSANNQTRLLIWKAWIRMNPIPAIDAALHYYLNTEEGSQDLDQNAAAADLLCATLRDASRRSDEFELQNGNITKLFSIYPNPEAKDTTRSVVNDKTTPNRRRVMTALLAFATSFHDIATIDRQIDFLSSKNPDEKGLVEKTNFANWPDRAVWLAIPRTSNSDMPVEAPPEQIIRHYRDLSSKLGKSAAWNPISLTVIDEDTATWLAQYAKVSAEDHTVPPPPPGTDH